MSGAVLTPPHGSAGIGNRLPRRPVGARRGRASSCGLRPASSAGGRTQVAIERTARARPRLAGSADPDARGRIRFGPPADPDRAEERLRAGISGVRLALGLVDLTDMRVEAVSNAVSDVLGLPVDRIVGRKAEEVIDARDRPGATAALEALRTGAIDFYRAYRGGAGITAPRRICAWVRRLDLSGRPHAFVRFGDPHLPPGPWPTGVDVFENAVAIAVTDGHG